MVALTIINAIIIVVFGEKQYLCFKESRE